MELSSPVVRPSRGLLPDSTTIFAPTQEMDSIQQYTQNIMMGLFSARIFSALEKFLASSPEMPVNFSTSFSSRTKDFTTRMPWTFSWTILFIRSIILKPLSKILNTIGTRHTRAMTRTGMTIR